MRCRCRPHRKSKTALWTSPTVRQPRAKRGGGSPGPRARHPALFVDKGRQVVETREWVDAFVPSLPVRAENRLISLPKERVNLLARARWDASCRAIRADVQVPQGYRQPRRHHTLCQANRRPRANWCAKGLFLPSVTHRRMQKVSNQSIFPNKVVFTLLFEAQIFRTNGWLPVKGSRPIRRVHAQRLPQDLGL